MIRPLGDRVLMQVIEPEMVTVSGIYLPDVAQEKTNRGIVVAVGQGRQSEMTGRPIPIPVEVGDEVIYSKYAGTEVELDDKHLILVRSEDLIAVSATAEERAAGELVAAEA